VFRAVIDHLQSGRGESIFQNLLHFLLYAHQFPFSCLQFP
jgi:hypothetical protein